MKLTTVPIPEQLASIIYHSYSPWFGTVDYTKTHLFVVHDTENGYEGEFDGQTRLSVAQINKAKKQAAEEGKLCCAADIHEFGIEMGCAEDGDIIAQFAIFGKLVFG